MLWVDKYRPHTLEKCTVHAQEAEHLKNLVSHVRHSLWSSTVVSHVAFLASLKPERDRRRVDHIRLFLKVCVS